VLVGVFDCVWFPAVKVESAGETVEPALVASRRAADAAEYGGGGLGIPSVPIMSDVYHGPKSRHTFCLCPRTSTVEYHRRSSTSSHPLSWVVRSIVVGLNSCSHWKGTSWTRYRRRQVCWREGTMQGRRRNRSMGRQATNRCNVDVQWWSSWEVTRPQGRGWRSAIPWWWWRKRNDDSGSPRGMLIFKLGVFSRRQWSACETMLASL
jgi:hypothetical protein